ncbi:MAG: FimB/Mfa2 family fimbrial subunit [Tannerellaceae bacterium]|nr:FimB/Mfa2 family fimbrial subunit [Tannerellaceae bacterium]
MIHIFALFMIIICSMRIFPQEVKELTVFVFDDEEKLAHIYKDEAVETFPSDYTMDVVLEENDYTFVVWSGLYDEFYTTPITRSETSINDLVIRLTPDEGDKKVKRRIPSLWHGKLEKKWDKTSPGTIRLIKNTNTIRVVMKNLDEEGDEVDINDFDIILSCSNGIYDSGNEPQGEPYEYYPYYTNNDPQTGAIAELNTLRLMSGQQNILEIIHRETGKNILGKKLNLNTYLDALRLTQYSELELQEYLDRENQYGILFFYKGFDKNNPSFIDFSMQINGWVVREQDIRH